jgi:hypothetical protein
MANYRVSTNTNNSNKRTQDKTTKRKTRKQRKVNQLRLFKLKHDLLKISIDLQTALAADTHLAEGQWLTEQLNLVKLGMFRVRTRRPTVSRTEGQYFVPQKAFIKNSASM